MRDGIHEMSMAEYRSAPGINQTSLKKMARSPAHFREYVANPPEPTRAQLLGTIFHLAVLQPELFGESYWIRPETYQNKKDEFKRWNGNSTECRDWLAAHEDRPIIQQQEHIALIAMRKSVLEHTSARAALAQGVSEQSLFVSDPDTGLKLKCRADRLTGNSVVDVKTTDDASLEGFARSVAKYGYDCQAAFVLDICNWLNLKKAFFIFIAVESDPPYAVAVYQLDDESIDVGRRKYRRWLDLYAHCERMNEWPAYSEDIEIISLPAWEHKRENQLLLNA